MQPEREELNGIQFDFSKENFSFTIRGRFFIQTEPSRLIHVLYDFGRLAEFMTIADSIELLRQGEDWHEVRYAYEKFIFKTKAYFRRTLEQDEQKITFEMIASERLGPFLPKLSSYNGYYEFIPEKNGCWIEYFQEVRVESKTLNWILFYQGKKVIVEFLKNLKRYIETQALHIPPQKE